MANITQRQKDILTIVRGLDIPPTLYKNAVEKYTALGNYLNEHGLQAEIYPQGSFAFGTVVRPLSSDSEASYDLDFICQVTGTRDDYAPGELRSEVENVLKSSKIYADRLKVYDTCFTIEYADIGDIGFSIDVVPAADESNENKSRLASKSGYPYLIPTSISIPKLTFDHQYEWITNNPRGFRRWFEDINKPFLAYSKEAERLRLFQENRTVFASVEEIPTDLERSALQRVIQILKYHRNRYYSVIRDGDNIKPISAIINVVVTKIAQSYRANCTVFELLEYTLNELEVYAQYQTLSDNEFRSKHGHRNVFTRPSGKWYIENPANPEDNLADHWNEDDRIPSTFFRWVKVVYDDFITALEQKKDEEFRAELENNFGKNSVSRFLGAKYSIPAAPSKINPSTAPRPYSH